MEVNCKIRKAHGREDYHVSLSYRRKDGVTVSRSFIEHTRERACNQAKFRIAALSR
jgi:hypothetical protein